MLVRQGDVIVFSEQAPDGAAVVPREDGRIILALGEATGHAHVVLDRDAELLSVADEVDRWLRVQGTSATLVHDEHGPITLPPGDYRVRIQRQYHRAEIRKVVD